MKYENTFEFAQQQDQQDPLRRYRDKFYHPTSNGEQAIYLAGHSLGLQPKTARDAIEVELSVWAKLGVDGHFHATNPWVSYHELLTPATARLVGANQSEVVCMNSLTMNLHLLFVSFYQPSSNRYKIISESKMFPSDRYLLETQARFHGFEPDDAIIEVNPRPGEFVIGEEDILDAIEANADQLAMVFFGGINYYTGQLFDIQKLTKAAHAAESIAGFDLAHAAGNVPMRLHDWDVDFAAWCTYKYINSSAGNVGSVFVHERHGTNFDLSRFGGWWGHDKDRRFLMENHFAPMAGAEGWQVSCTPVMGMSLLKASLDLFDDAGIDNLRRKSISLTGYLEYVFNEVTKQFPEFDAQIITPRNPEQRGCQLSIKLTSTDRKFFDALTQTGVITDFREPDTIRMAPVPLYNSYEDVYRFGTKLQDLLQHWST